MRALAASATLAGLLFAGGCAREDVRPQPLHDVYQPTVAPVPPREPTAVTIERLKADWHGEPGDSFRRDLRSPQAAIALLALALILFVAFDFRRPLSSRNIDLLLLYAAGAVLFDVMRFFRVLDSPTYLNLLDWVFSVVVALGCVIIFRALSRATRRAAESWVPNPGTGILIVVSSLVLAADIGVAIARPPDDAGWFVNLGAQRLRERARLPYGDPLLTGTPGAAYGPLLYAAHIPFQLILSPHPVNEQSPAMPQLGDQSTYFLPPRLATKLCAAVFHLAGVVALLVAVRRITDVRAALGVVALYCGSLAVLGIGGAADSVAGITFVSHIAPAAATLIAFAALPWPAISGVLLVIAAGMGFYPAFMAPAWLGYYWNNPAHRWRFAVALTVSALALGAAIYAASRPAGERSRVGTILYDTVGHHTDPKGYGSSPFGFWGQRGGLRRVFSTPLIGDSGLTTPAWLLFAALMAATFVLARGRSAAQLASLAGAVALGATLVKPHATGTYLAWYYGLILVGVLGERFTSGDKKV
jgi:hypothetical protein